MEGGEGLGLLPGEVVQLPPGLPLPHMGWNLVEVDSRGEPLFAGVPADQRYFYFAHSYAVQPGPGLQPVGVVRYGVTFPAVIWQDRVLGVQFHPEKSGSTGARLLRNVWEVVMWSAFQPSISSEAPSSG
jgi:glutamine amidotransferase